MTHSPAHECSLAQKSGPLTQAGAFAGKSSRLSARRQLATQLRSHKTFALQQQDTSKLWVGIVVVGICGPIFVVGIGRHVVVGIGRHVVAGWRGRGKEKVLQR